MKLYNPFKSKSSNITSDAVISVSVILSFCFGWFISKVGAMAAVSMLVAVIILLMVLAPFYVTIKYIFTGKE